MCYAGTVTHDETATALAELLRELDAQPGSPISLYDIVQPLVAKGHEESVIVDVLYSMQAAKEIELLPGNRMQVLKQP